VALPFLASLVQVFQREVFEWLTMLQHDKLARCGIDLDIDIAPSEGSSEIILATIEGHTAILFDPAHVN
jgi:hypothetical protein